MTPDRLRDYRRKRDFGATPEPAGPAPAEEPPRPDGAAGTARFVIQQHDATRLHWDLRLEHDGVLASWALPRGLPSSPDKNHLAVHTEDHPMEYLTFAGDIPAGSYGAGHMFVWDTGTYETEKWEEKKVTVILHGEKVRGRYALFQTRGRDWMVHRMDPPLDPSRRPPPADLRPMRARSGSLPSDGREWAFDLRWVGARVLVSLEPGQVTIIDATGRDVGAAFPEVRRMGRATGSLEAVIDGVIVAVGADGAPRADEALIAHRLAASSDSTRRRLSERQPAALMAFDVLWLEGHDVTALPWADRRQLLDDLALSGPAWQAPAAHRGDGEAMVVAVRQQGLPGLVAKSVDSRYRPGEVSDDWIEIATEPAGDR